jgi:hypothetical protein
VTCTKYASLSGSDSGDGVTTPYLTIQKLVDSLNPGDTGCVHAGTYSSTAADQESAVDFNHGGAQGAPITLTTAPGDARATLRFKLQISSGSDYVTVSGLILDGEDNPAFTPNPIVDGADALVTGNDISNHDKSSTFNSSTGLWEGNICVSVAGADDTIQLNTIHDCGNKADPDLFGGSRNHHHGIYVTTGVRPQILGNWIYDNAARGVQFYPDADGATVVGNVIDGNGWGVSFGGGNTTSSDNNVVERNVISNSDFRWNVYGNWPGPVGTGNVARDNCVYADPSLDSRFQQSGGIAPSTDADGNGFSAYNNKIGNPTYVDRGTGKNFNLQPGSPCATISNPWEEPLGDTIASAPAATSMETNSMDVYAQSTSGTLFHKWYRSGAWAGTESLGGTVTSAPTAVAWCAHGLCTEHRMDIFTKGGGNELEHKWWTGSAWSGWVNMGNSLNSAPSASSRGQNRVDVFWRGTDNALRHEWWDGVSWSATESLSPINEMTTGPAAVSWSSGRIDVFWRGNDNTLHHKWWISGSGWSGIESLGGTLTGKPTVSSNASGDLDVFVRGPSNDLWQKSYSTGSGWSGWLRLGGQLAANNGPGAVTQGSTKIDVFTQGTDNKLWHTWWDGSSWRPFPCPYQQRAC